MGNRVGIAVATFNSVNNMKRCLTPLMGHGFALVLFDDGSRDGTVEAVRSLWHDVVVLRGNGQAWWAGGTKAAVEECFRIGCDYALMLNPDVGMDGAVVWRLVEYAEQHPKTIVAPLVVDSEDPTRIAWGGARFGRVAPILPLYANRYVFKRGDPVSRAGSRPYEVDEAHGRGVLVSKEVYNKIGTLDAEKFPHYGADNDYSMRARRAGIAIVVIPDAIVLLDISNTGMIDPQSKRLRERMSIVWHYLTERKSGEALRVNWLLAHRHLPPVSAVSSFVLWTCLGAARRLFPPRKT